MKNEIKTDKYYNDFIELETFILKSKQKVWRKVNYEQIFLYWYVGNYVSIKLNSAKWGQKIVSSFVRFLRQRNPQIKGFDRRAIYRMIQFYTTYSNNEFVAALQPLLPKNNKNQIVVALQPQLKEQDNDVSNNPIIELIAQISWSAHLEILSGCNSNEERVFYILLAKNERLTYRELGRQIDTGVYERTIRGNQKLSVKLKEAHPNIANILKDRYMIDYLQLPFEHNEKDIQKGLLKKMKNFILDLGKDFLFVDEEYRVQVGVTDFFIDLLFYHRTLRCFVAIELKSTKFKPEYLGKLEFYLEALDKDIKHKDENPSIGILLCKSTDNEVVEYALNRSVSPAMVAKYEQELVSKELLKTYLKEIE